MLEIKNFRGIQKAALTLPEHAVLMGANNAGKSTILDAIALLFAREKMVRPLSDWDFYDGFPKPESRFYIIATLTNFPSQDPLDAPDWFVGQSCARPSWWYEKTAKLSFGVDPPDGSLLAAQVALSGRYDEETCEFETQTYFYYGEGDPFTEECVRVPLRLLREVGVFLLSSNREWDRLLSFTSSSLLKLLRENEAIPGATVETIKHQLANDIARIEDAEPLSRILAMAAKELQSFMLIDESSKISYRPTSLDTWSVLQSLVAHISNGSHAILPVARHGSGTISLQAFLLLLAFAERRSVAGRNFILAAEEPELHLHPSLHQRLVSRIRAASSQSIVTTQSPRVAAGYQPSEVVFVRNVAGTLEASLLRTEPVKEISSNSVRNLYLVKRDQLYEALMGSILLVPEGVSDYEWLKLWQRVAQSSPEAEAYNLTPACLVPTFEASVVETFQEVARFRPDALPIVDGDAPGLRYIAGLRSTRPSPAKIVRFGDDASIECLAAWLLEPSLANSGPILSEKLNPCTVRSVRVLQDILFESKKDRQLREDLAWEALDNEGCRARACEFFHDISAILRGAEVKNSGWVLEEKGSTQLFTASHIKRA